MRTALISGPGPQAICSLHYLLLPSTPDPEGKPTGRRKVNKNRPDPGDRSWSDQLVTPPVPTPLALQSFWGTPRLLRTLRTGSRGLWCRDQGAGNVLDRMGGRPAGAGRGDRRRGSDPSRPPTTGRQGGTVTATTTKTPPTQNLRFRAHSRRARKVAFYGLSPYKKFPVGMTNLDTNIF